MTDDEKQAIEYLKTRLSLLRRNYQFATEQAIETVLKLIQKQNQIIDLMAEQLTTPEHNKEWILDYYKNKI